eukprot:GAHX01002040.1.p1 GENE.GAHX01002040.1~~GAHX01002040.1.p1  ORF type:complete len:451 (-),score=88.72 GAHX01002040.1:25-1377(-)
MLTKQDSEKLEKSPDGRYIRYEQKIGKGAFKKVWKGFDTENGTEVAWNKINLGRFSAPVQQRIKTETEILESIQQENIIKFYHSWINPENELEINFITELVSYGALRDYIDKIGKVKTKVVKNWAYQILKGLQYLHSRSPPIAHRDLKCSNIFINSSNGAIRIGDLGLSTRTSDAMYSFLGTPEFMAPELYEEHYTELVDIYAFGMCLLEMTTKEYPYSECINQAQIYKKVTQGLLPQALFKIEDMEIQEFMKLCLAPVYQRLTAFELLNHPFLVYRNNNNSPNFLLTNSNLFGMVKIDPAKKQPSIDVDKTLVTKDSDNNGFKIVLYLTNSKSSKIEFSLKEGEVLNDVLQELEVNLNLKVEDKAKEATRVKIVQHIQELSDENSIEHEARRERQASLSLLKKKFEKFEMHELIDKIKKIRLVNDEGQGNLNFKNKDEALKTLIDLLID